MSKYIVETFYTCSFKYNCRNDKLLSLISHKSTFLYTNTKKKLTPERSAHAALVISDHVQQEKHKKKGNSSWRIRCSMIFFLTFESNQKLKNNQVIECITMLRKSQFTPLHQITVLYLEKQKVGKTEGNVHCTVCICTMRTLFFK